jgi:endonuclease-3
MPRLLTKQEITTIFQRFEAASPHPITELVAPNPFCLLVAIVLSAQATDISVTKATAALFAVADSPHTMLALGEAGVANYIKTIGLYNSKAKNIIRLCDQLLTDHGGEIPQERDQLQQLAGVGRKTANVWLNCVLGLPLMAVDTHVFRVSNRLGLCRAATVLACEEALMRRIPAPFLRHAHHWLILHGRYICKARHPACHRCHLRDICRFIDKTD